MNGQQRLELLTAALAGKTIQFQLAGSKRWQDYPDPEVMKEGKINFFGEFDWRVKPDPMVIYARITESGTIVSVSTIRKTIEENHPVFRVGRFVKFVEVAEDESN